MHCCTGNHARAIWYAWHHILHHQEGTLKVNLLLNRASKTADVDSYLPYLGKLVVKMKKTRRVQVRITKSRIL